MNYNALTAKISGQRRNLLNDNDYKSLSTLNDVPGVIRYLQQTNGYSNVLYLIPELRRSFLEERLALSFQEDYFKLYTFIPDFNIRRFLEAYYLKYEFKVLKQLIRTILDMDEISEHLPLLHILTKFEDEIDLVQISKVHDIHDFVHCFEHSKLYNFLTSAVLTSEDSFQVDSQLDIHFYTNIWKNVKKNFTGDDRTVLLDLIGTEIDLQNIMWIYRFKNSYDIENSLIYSFLVPIHYHVHKDYIIKLAQSNDIEDFRKILDTGPYKHFFDKFNLASSEEIASEIKNPTAKDVSKSFSFGNCYFDFMLNKHLKWYRKHPKSMASIMLFLFEKEWEANNLVNITEAIRYNASNSDIINSLHYRKKGHG